MPLTRDQLQSLSRLLDEALALPPEARADWLAALTPDLEPLRARLSVALDGAADRVGSPADGSGPLATLPRLTELGLGGQAGQQVGPWRLMNEIGRGGMGTVWLAERADGAYERQVALKLPRLSWSDDLASRMAQERRIIARLEHPGIARLYDAGVDGQGRPYLAMAFIDGLPIDAWVRRRQLPVREALALFVQVVRAVSHAHARLVVHRDLKPSNVLVDANGSAHLLDFGIAKLLYQDGDPTLTADVGLAMTPHYAAPEQLTGQPIGVQADVYSLGVMLYELVTDTLPYALPRMSLGALERAMLEDEPRPASGRVQDRARAAALRGDVDAILAKALKRDPLQRYVSADALAEDIERHLRGDSISARPDASWHRVARLVRRHRVAVGAAALALLALLGGGAATLIQARRAEDALTRERQVRVLVGDLLRSDNHGLSQEQVLQRHADTVRARLPDEPALQAELYGLLATTFGEMGLSHLAVQHGTRQIELLVKTAAPPADRVQALLQLGRAQLDNQQLGEAERHARDALALVGRHTALERDVRVLLVRVLVRQSRRQEADGLLGDLGDSPPSAAPSGVAEAWVTYLRADALRRQGDFAAALPRYQSAIALAQRAGASGRGDAAQMQLDLAYELIVRNRREQALPLMESALAVLAASGPLGAVNALVQRAALVTNMGLMGQLPVAEALHALNQTTADLQAQGAAASAVARARLDFHRARLLGKLGQVRQALTLLDAAVPVLWETTAWANARFSLVNAHGRMAMQAGEHSRAREMLARSLALRQEMGHAKIPFAAVTHTYIVLNALMEGRTDEAERALDAAPIFEAERSDPVSGAIYATLIPWHRARLHLQRGDMAAAVALAGRLGRGEEDPEDTDFLSPAAIHAEIACASGRTREGLDQLQRVIAMRTSQVDDADPTLARLRALAARCAEGHGDHRLARSLTAAAQRAFDLQPQVSPWFKSPLQGRPSGWRALR